MKGGKETTLTFQKSGGKEKGDCLHYGIKPELGGGGGY